MVPGEYTLEIVAAERRDRQVLVVRPDPRVKASAADLAAQYDMATRLTDALATTFDGYTELRDLRATVAERIAALGKTPRGKQTVPAVEALDARLDAIQSGTAAAPGLGVVNRDMARFYQMLLSGDARPSQRLRESATDSCQALTAALESWRKLVATDLPAVNRAFARAKLPPVVPGAVPAAPPCVP